MSVRCEGGDSNVAGRCGWMTVVGSSRHFTVHGSLRSGLQTRHIAFLREWNEIMDSIPPVPLCRMTTHPFG
jgi:hypothetical protein